MRDSLARIKTNIMPDSVPIFSQLQPINTEDMLNTALKDRGVNRTARRRYFASKKKPRKAPRR